MTDARHIEAQIYERLSKVIDPELGRSITDLGMIAAINAVGVTSQGDGDVPSYDVTVHVELTVEGCPLSQTITNQINGAVASYPDATLIPSIEVGSMSQDKLTQLVAGLKAERKQNPFNKPGIKTRIFAIASGKGGVGKSSTAVNLALALAAEGAKVGILDADIYGPSIPTMLGAENQRPTSPDGTHMAPIMSHGLATNSIGYLVTDDNAMVWRGPMASKALMQMLQETLWPDLDYLVLDMPPGTGDIQLTLAQNIPVTGAVVVTTPQDIALIDAKKGIVMFEKVEVPVLGIVENMSVHICSNCGHHEPIFGTGGAEKLAEKYHTQLLGQMPLHISLREDLDKGTPTVISRPESEFTAIYRQLADRVAAQLYWQGEVIPGEISFRAV